MSNKRPATPPVSDADHARGQQALQTLLRDLEGVERLQQMQLRLLREVLQSVKKLDLA
ncbi:MAG: hypothetical protein AB7U20_06965 [Planctomycetaceae bacterium]